MDFNNVMTAITTVGFPIVACAVMFWYMNKERESHQQETKELTSAITGLQTTIQQNTVLLERVVDKLGE